MARRARASIPVCDWQNFKQAVINGVHGPNFQFSASPNSFVISFVICTVARTGGSGATLGLHCDTSSRGHMHACMPAVRAMQPQVSLTSGRAHTRAAPGDAPGYLSYVCMYVCMYVCRAFDRQVPIRVMGFNGDGHLLQTLSPSIHR
jgi:hypothetical protein